MENYGWKISSCSELFIGFNENQAKSLLKKKKKTNYTFRKIILGKFEIINYA